jgi:uncharacterized protein with NRDE domain
VCLIAFAWQAHADYPLIVAGNRDEFFARPTASADWSADGRTLAGKDLKGGGTWMGVSRDGRFAALTNYRDPPAFRPDAPSRGELVDRVLREASMDATLRDIAKTSARFNGFNLLAARWRPDDDANGLWIVSSSVASRPAPVAPGIHGLSNAVLDTPWPKVNRAVDGMREALATSPDTDTLVERLFALLTDDAIVPDVRLPRTGVSLEFERALSATFIRMPGYGTRSSTVLIVDRRGHETFVERRCEPDVPVAERRFAFDGVATASVP